MFIKKNPDITDQVIKYNFINCSFKQIFSLSFGRPQVDVCSISEQLKTKISDPNLNESGKRVAAAERIVRKRRAKCTS
jgi:hypothetical protein